MAIERSDVIFESGGERCVGWLFTPEHVPGRAPCVVMAHGTTATMSFGLEWYARRFADAGCVVLVFDYRHFGRSDGEPRQLVDVHRQLEDWRAAIGYARSLPGVDPGHIALWGTSLSAGHVITLAAEDPTIAAVIAQLPFLGIDRSRSSPRGLGVTARLFRAAVADSIGARLGRAARTVPMVGVPGSVAVFTGTEDLEVTRILAADAPDWHNEITARSLWSLIAYRPRRLAGRLTMPLLVCIAEEDTAASVPFAIDAARAAPRGELRRYPGGHFAAYLPPVLDRMVDDEVAFLRRHLHLQRPAATTAG